MSGWICITVEPKDVSGEEIAPYEMRYEIMSQAATLVGHEEPSVGPKACGLTADHTLETLYSLEDLIEEARAETGLVDAEEEVEEWLKEWSHDFFLGQEDSLIRWMNTPTVQYPGRGDPGSEPAEEIFENCPYANRVLVIAANDTSDSGTGWLWGCSDAGDVHMIDEKEGYERARAADVQGYFQDEHGIHGATSPY